MGASETKVWWRIGLVAVALVVLVGAWQLLLALGGVMAVSKRLAHAPDEGGRAWGSSCPPDQSRPLQRSGGPVPDGGIAALALGGNRSCALTNGGRTYCWGVADVSPSELRRHGQLVSDGRLWLQGPREPYEGIIKFGRDPELSLAAPNAVALAQNRFAYCTLDGASVLNCSSVSARDLYGPTYAPSVTLPNVKSVAVGVDHACALTTTHEAWCWGKNDWGQLGLSPGAPVVKPTQVRSHVARVALGLGHTCILTNDAKARLECFGNDTLGQLGGFGRSASPSPLPSFDVTDVTELSAGYSRTCALLGSGSVWCWGGYLAVDLAANQPSFAPGLVGQLPADVVQIAAGGDVICARSTHGSLHCWGVLQCLDPHACPSPAHPQASPAQLMKTAMPATNVQVGEQHICALLQGGQVACLGANQFSQLGGVLPLRQRLGPAPCLTEEWFEAWSSSEFLPVMW